MLLSELVRDLPNAELRGPDLEVVGVTFDSRKVKPGYLFVCVRGQAFDGHDFAAEAVAAGAAALLVERAVGAAGAAAQVRVPDARKALAAVAKRFWGAPDEGLGLIGVTGTDGKTTTCRLIASILREAGYRTGEVTTAGLAVGGEFRPNPVHQTTPSSLELQELLHRMLKVETQWAVVETTSHGLSQYRVEGLAFNRAVFTRITSEHLEFHGTVEAYVEAKSHLLDLLADSSGGPWGKAAVLNFDDPHCEALRKRARSPVLTYGRGAAADFRIRTESAGPAGVTFEADTPQGVLRVQAGLPGRFNVDNCLAAAACAVSIGVGIGVCAEAIGRFEGVPGRMQRVRCGQPFEVIVDYAHTEESLRAVLETLRAGGVGRIIAVFGSAGERDVRKRPAMGAVAARLADHFIITDEDPRGEQREKIARDISDGALTANPRASFEVILERREAVAKALRLAGEGDMVLLAGKGHERSIITASGEIPWDEAGVARELLSAMGYSPADLRGTA